MHESSLQEPQLIRGVLRRVTFHNPSNGYSVLQIAVSGGSELLTVVGTSPELRSGAHLVVRGTFKNHPKFGKQLAAVSIVETAPEKPEELMKYLASGTIKGIGGKTAERIVEAFGAETMQVIQRSPERLAEIPGIGAHKATLICAAFASQNEAQEIMRFLIGHDLSPTMASKIHHKYGPQTIELLTQDPYRLARDITGIGFMTADRIAMALGLDPASPNRIRAGLLFALERAAEDGHCFLPVDQMAFRARQLLSLGDDYSFSDVCEALIAEGLLIRRPNGIYLPHLSRAEDFVADFIAARCAPRQSPLLSEASVGRALSDAARQLGVQFSQEQELCVYNAAQYPFLIITGGPGCGKTTIIRALSLLFRNSGKRLLLAAPTGRAAQRMAQVCETQASTIHRLLKYDPVNRGFRHNIKDQLIADAIVIDEASMIDLPLAMSLFSAISKNTTLILVGDRDQLPSVGPGRVFADLVSMHQVRTIALSMLFRRAEESAITRVAHDINAGRVADIPTPDGKTVSDAYFVARSDAHEAAATIENLVADIIPKKFGIPSTEITVLTPSNRGPLGALLLNRQLQGRLNPRSAIDPEQEIMFGESAYRTGDRVCQLVNNYNLGDIGVFNGDVGIISQISKSAAKLTVDMWDGRLITYDTGEVHQLGLAYAITVHRSQGSEISCVVLALHDSHYTLLERQLIYTAVTRAKKLLIVVGSKRALLLATKRTNAAKRLTALPERIREILGAPETETVAIEPESEMRFDSSEE